MTLLVLSGFNHVTFQVCLQLVEPSGLKSVEGILEQNQNTVSIPLTMFSWNSYVRLFGSQTWECVMLSLVSRVQLSVTQWTVTRQAPLSMGILQARILEWVAMTSPGRSSQPRDRTQVSCIAGGFFTS